MSAGEDDSTGDSRQAIFIESGKAPELADQALTAALENGARIWKSGGQLVTIAEDTTTTSDRVKRPKGAPRRMPLSPVSLSENLTRHVRFYKWDARNKDYKPIDCPQRLAAALVERGSWPVVPELHGFVGGPTLRADGTPVTTAGYDADSGLYVADWGLGDVHLPGPGVGADMFRTLAQAAGARLEEAVGSLPFVDDEDRTAAVAAIMTGTCARSIEAAPGFGISAPTAGTGKTNLADFISITATGQTCAVMSLGKDDNEFEKRLISTLLMGDQVICIDNTDRPVGGDLFCQSITSGTLGVRPLGVSQKISIPSRSLILMTGNNIVIRGDLNRRVLIIRLDAKCERPEEREFERDLLEDARTHRRDLVEAALTITHAYHLAGCPPVPDLPPFGGFTAWDRLVRRPLAWAGFGDPLAPSAEYKDDDPDRSAMRALFHAWIDRYGDEAVTAAQVIDDATAGTPRFDGKGSDLADEAMHDVIAQILGGKITARAFGYVLRRYRDRLVDGLKLEHLGPTGRNKVVGWRVVRL